MSRPPGQSNPSSPERPPGVLYAPVFTRHSHRTDPYAHVAAVNPTAALMLHPQHDAMLQIPAPASRTVRWSQVVAPQPKTTLRVRVVYPQSEDDWGNWNAQGFQGPPWRNRAASPPPIAEAPRTPVKRSSPVPLQSAVPPKLSGTASSVSALVPSRAGPPPRPPAAAPPPPPAKPPAAVEQTSESADLNIAKMRENIYGKHLASMETGPMPAASTSFPSSAAFASALPPVPPPPVAQKAKLQH